ncbi:MAG: protein kinase [Candidatus Acidoferrales bacterium]|nr:protein kinase [Candidatus Acidoferrales bacterium]
MALANGSRLGSYEVLSLLGAGGMGEVYRAHDSKLGRDVALKVLPEAFARDADRMARFQREAKVLASLNHSNIASIYGLEDSGSTHALVMELVEGTTLADRIKSGPIPIDEALRIAKQITEALEYAHERGIVHRDLKPANVKVKSDDAVKVLDFGLAKAIEGDAASMDIGNSPTISRMATQAGVLLGTAAYMSPEQAKAKPVDRRADIWAFRCVLCEMLAGKTAFRGETVTDTLAAVIRAEPDWSQLPAATPTRVRVLLQRCLQKDPKQRLRDIGDARISLEEVLAGAPEPPSVAAAAVSSSFDRRGLILSACALLLAAVASLATWVLRPLPPAPSQPVTRTAISLPPGQQLAGLDRGPAVAISQDGTHLAYVAAQGGAQQIYVRAMDSLEAKPIPGTEGAIQPFFSPDGQWLAFFAGGKLKKVPLTGGAPLTLGDAPIPNGGSWSGRGTIVFAPTTGEALQQVSDSGGTPQPLTRLANASNRHGWPEFLPGGNAVLFDVGGSQVAVQSIGTGERRTLVQKGNQPRYALSGHLVYAQGGSLMAVPFNPQRLEVAGSAVPVVEGVLESSSPLTGSAQYSFSATGLLVYIPGGIQSAESRLVWVSRNGAEQPLAAAPHAFDRPRISPDGRQVTMTIGEQERDVWLYNLARDTLTRLTFEGSTNAYPIWTPDGKRIAFLSNRDGPNNFYWQLADGSGGLERLTTSEYTQAPQSWSPDGQLVAFIEINATTGYDIWVLRIGDRKAQPFLRTPFNESAPEFSPDGRWLAYVSDESGRFEIYVQPYPGPGGKWQISTDGGTEPVWNRNGRELFYRSGDKMMAAAVATQPSFFAGKPRMLFEGAVLADPANISKLRRISRRPVLPDAQTHRTGGNRTDADQRRVELVCRVKAPRAARKMIVTNAAAGRRAPRPQASS